jgi:hypothetical protein
MIELNMLKVLKDEAFWQLPGLSSCWLCGFQMLMQTVDLWFDVECIERSLQVRVVD